MPIEVGFWDISSGNIQKIEYSPIESEKKLEDIISTNLEIISDDLLFLGRQILTQYGKKIDLLAIDVEGKVSIVELKRDRTPRDVVAQAIDYASWVQNLSYAEIKEIYEDHNKEKVFEQAFNEKFGTTPPDKINNDHDLVIVCAELDVETERIINYLSDNYNVPINAVFFRYFENAEQKYLSRSWLIDPNEVIEKATKSKAHSKGEVWNGRDFVVNVDVVDDISTWDDCIKYKFVSAGGGKWYSRSLSQLFVGARVFAMIPKKGYLGVGKVVDISKPSKDFKVEHEGREKSILDVPLKADGIKRDSDNLDLCEYFVKVEWLKTISEQDAFWVKGLRANQNSAFRLMNKFTLDKLTEFFGLDD